MSSLTNLNPSIIHQSTHSNLKKQITSEKLRRNLGMRFIALKRMLNLY